MAITLNGTTGITTPGTDSTTLTVNANNISASNSLGFRNRIINGAMMIDQRNAGASVTPADGAYTLDRWYADNPSAKFSVQQNAGSVTPPVGFRNYLGVTSLSSYSITATDIYTITQRIEGFNTADFNFGTANASTITFSFWVRSSLTGTFGGSLRNSGNTRNYPFSYTISASNTWEYKTITIAGDTTGTWLTNNGVGLGVSFGLGVGSTYSGTAGAWTGTSNIFSATGAVSVVGTNGATFYITGVQLEVGSVATPFERIDYGSQLIQCQRYFQIVYNGTIFIAQSSNNGYLFPTFSPMRASPSISASASINVDNNVNANYTQSSNNVANGTPTSATSTRVTAGNFTGLTSFNIYTLTNSGGYLLFSSEL